VNFLAITLALPLIGFFAILFTRRNTNGPFVVAFSASILTFIASLGLIANAGVQFGSVVDRP